MSQTVAMSKTASQLDLLQSLYADWCAAQGLPAVSADEQQPATQAQRDWLSAFVVLWDAAAA